MKNINLLPWRKQKREEETNLVTEWMYFSFGVGLTLGIILYLYALNQSWDAEQAIEVLKNEIAVSEKAIKEIDKYQELKNALIARMEVVQTLKSSRVLTVHLLDELVNIMPEGVVLMSFKRVGNVITIQGTAESNTNVSRLMKKIEQNKWMGQPILSDIKRPNKPDPKEKFLSTSPFANEFELTFTLESKDQKKGNHGAKPQ